MDDSNARMIYVLVYERDMKEKLGALSPKHDHLFIWFIITITLVYYTYIHWQIRYSLMRFLLRGMKLIPVPAFQERGQIVGHLSSQRTCACSYRNPVATQWAEFSMLRGVRARAPRNHEWNPPLNARGVQLHSHSTFIYIPPTTTFSQGRVDQTNQVPRSTEKQVSLRSFTMILR